MGYLSLFCFYRDPWGGSPGLINFLPVKWRTGTDPHLLGLLTLFSFAGWMRDGVHFVLALLYLWDRFCPPGGTFGQPRGLGLSKGVQVQREAGLQTVATCPSAKLRLSLHPWDLCVLSVCFQGLLPTGGSKMVAVACKSLQLWGGSPSGVWS